MTREFIAYLKGSIEMQIHVTQHVEIPADKINTSNPIVKESILTGDPKGYDHINAKKPKTEAEIRCDQLVEALQKATEENERLRHRLAELELKVEQLEGTPKPMSNLREAQLLDSIVNG